MNAPTPLVQDFQHNIEVGGTGRLVDRFTDHGSDGTTWFLTLSWVDDNRGHWSKEKLIPLGKTGDPELIRWFGPMGRYRTRQYQFVFESAAPVALLGVTDQVVGMGD